MRLAARQNPKGIGFADIPSAGTPAISDIFARPGGQGIGYDHKPDAALPHRLDPLRHALNKS